MQAPAPHRPRVEGAREQEILHATLELLTETGYDRLTLDAVATRARASKATLYRRWSSKAALVVDAVGCRHIPPVDPPDTGGLRSDLLALIKDKPHSDTWPGEDLALLLGLITAMTRDVELRDAVRTRFLEPVTATTVTVLRRARDRGELRDGTDLDLLAATLPALVLFRLSVAGPEEPFPVFATKVVDDLILPAALARH